MKYRCIKDTGFKQGVDLSGIIRLRNLSQNHYLSFKYNINEAGAF